MVHTQLGNLGMYPGCPRRNQDVSWPPQARRFVDNRYAVPLSWHCSVSNCFVWAIRVVFRAFVAAAAQVYPIGIPALYAAILWKKRDLLNPRIHTDKPDGVDGFDEAATRTDPAREDGIPFAMMLCATPKVGQARDSYSPRDIRELEERVKARRENPKLVPSMFLWKDFGESEYMHIRSMEQIG